MSRPGEMLWRASPGFCFARMSSYTSNNVSSRKSAMNDFRPTRRAMIRSMVGGSLLWPGILSQLLAEDSGALGTQTDASDPLGVKQPHFAPKAKRVIFLFATGGVSHIDTFDPKHNGRDG